VTIEEYGDHLNTLIASGDWANIEREIHGINLPDGWPDLIRPIFADLAGKELSVEVLDFADLPEHVLHWLKMAPAEVLALTRKAIRVSYDTSDAEGEDSGNLDLAIYEQASGPSILMVGG